MAAILTVVVIVYNDERRLARAVRSVQRQTLGRGGSADLEILIVDDASTDGTREVAERGGARRRRDAGCRRRAHHVRHARGRRAAGRGGPWSGALPPVGGQQRWVQR